MDWREELKDIQMSSKHVTDIDGSFKMCIPLSDWKRIYKLLDQRDKEIIGKLKQIRTWKPTKEKQPELIPLDEAISTIKKIKMIKFQSIESFTIKNRGKVFIVKKPKDYNFLSLINKKVLIDNKCYLVKGIEIYPKKPYRQNNIGLLVKTVDVEKIALEE